MAEKGVDAGLVARTGAFEPGKDVGVDADGDGALDGAVELADGGAAPVGEFRGVGEVDFVVRETGEGGEFLG